MERHEWMTAVAAVVGAAAGVCAIDGFAIEPYRLAIRHVRLSFPELPSGFDGLRIAQISDLHLHSYGRIYHLVVEAVHRERPDLVVITGDLVDRSGGMQTCQTFIQDLQRASGAPIFAVPGNWDHRAFNTRQAMATWQEEVAKAGAHPLVNRSVRLSRYGDALWLAGTDDPYFGHADLDATLRMVPFSGFTIVLTHAPELFEELARRPSVRLVLAGHTHGGQVRLPMIGALHVPSRYGTRFAWGLYRIGETTYYVNPGIGMSHLPVRFLCRPELTVMTLRSGDSASVDSCS